MEISLSLAAIERVRRKGGVMALDFVPPLG
jgi:hypothetical protein